MGFSMTRKWTPPKEAPVSVAELLRTFHPDEPICENPDGMTMFLCPSCLAYYAPATTFQKTVEHMNAAAARPHGRRTCGTCLRARDKGEGS